MKLRLSSLAAVAASLVLCRTGLAEETQPPSTGVDYLGSGAALTAIGALVLATAPVCKTGVVTTAEQGTCFSTSFLIGAPILALGVPLIVFGSIQHERYLDWARRHPAVGALSFSPTSRGASLAWAATF